MVGSGIAGLCAAIEAGRAGAAVFLLASAPPGGRARTAVSDSGFRLNVGPHALYTDGELHELLTGLGVALGGGPPALRGARLRHGGATCAMPTGVRSLAATGLLTVAGKARFARFLRRLTGTDPAGLAGTPVSEWLGSAGLDAPGRSLAAALVRLATYDAHHDEFSADAALVQLKRSLRGGVTYIDGGWERIVSALLDEAVALGVRLAEPQRVLEVRTGCVVTNRTTWNPAAVVLGGLPPESVGELVGRPDVALRSGHVVHAAVLDIGTRTPARPTDAPSGFLLGVDEPLYWSRHSPPADLAPPGTQLYSAMRYLGPGHDPDPDALRRELRDHARMAGVEEPSVVHERYLHRLVVAQGSPTAAGGGLAGRPAVDSLGVPGVFIAGDWVGPDGLLADAAAASGRAAGRAAAEHAASQPVPPQRVASRNGTPEGER